MTLVRYRPNKENDLFPRRFSDLLDDFFNDAFVNTPATEALHPKLDVSETENSYEIEAHLPGMKKDEISVDVENGRLTISGERERKEEDSDRKFHRVESSYGSFTRTLQLPENADEENVKARYEDGVLHVSVNKDEEKVSKKIEIE